MAKFVCPPVTPVPFRLDNGAPMFAPITAANQWACRPGSGPIYAASEQKCQFLAATVSVATIPVDAACDHVVGGFAGWISAPAARQQPQGQGTQRPSTPWMDKARQSATNQAKAAKAASDKPRSVLQTRHMLNMALDQGLATLAGEMNGDLAARSKSAQTALANYLKSCAFFGAEADPDYAEAVNGLVEGIANRLATG